MIVQCIRCHVPSLVWIEQRMGKIFEVTERWYLTDVWYQDSMSKSPDKNPTTTEGMFKSPDKDWVLPAADIYFWNWWLTFLKSIKAISDYLTKYLKIQYRFKEWQVSLIFVAKPKISIAPFGLDLSRFLLQKNLQNLVQVQKLLSGKKKVVLSDNEEDWSHFFYLFYIFIYKCSERLRKVQIIIILFLKIFGIFFRAMFESPDKNGTRQRSVRKSG